MATRVYKMFVSNAGVDADAAVYADILRAGTLVAAQLTADIDSVTDNSYMALELSTQSNSFAGSNNSLGDFALVSWRANGTAPIGFLNQYLPLSVPLQYGQRVYLNIGAGGTLDAGITVYLWVQE